MADLDAAIRAKLPVATSVTPDLAAPYNALRGAVLAALEEHGVMNADSHRYCRRCVTWSTDADGDLMAEPLQDPCPTKRAIAKGLGIEVET